VATGNLCISWWACGHR